MTMGTSWSPRGFDRFRALFPATPPLCPEPDAAGTARFIAAWEAGEAAAAASLAPRAPTTTVVLVRGYLGRYMPGHFHAARRALGLLGFDVFIARTRAGGDVATNVAALRRHLARRPTRPRLVFAGHSRGGLECLTLLKAEPALAARCDGVALSQTPRGPSRVIESVLLGRHRERRFRWRRRLSEAAQRAALLALGARRGGLELSSEVWPLRVAAVEGVAWPFPVLQTASWSLRPTAWLDSFHGRLAEIGPGRAHDGQFFLDDLVWPGLPHVLLPEVDHAQPAMGGCGFDAARYWVTVLAVLLTPHEEDR